jgi:amino acid adenylation domain-containing protein
MIPRRAPGAVAPMSFAQELLWMLDRATPGLTAYNVPRAIEIRGRLDVDALRHALSDVVARHEILRTTYAAGEQGPVQVIAPAHEVELPVLDLSNVAAEARSSEIDRIVLEEARMPLDLARGPLLRARLLRAGSEEHTLVLVTHHIASDGWSKGVLYRDLSAAYDSRLDGRAPVFVPLPIQYADFAAWQREAMQGEQLESHLAYWRRRLESPLPVLELPTDFPRPAVQSFEGAREIMMLPASLVAQLRELGMDHGATLYMVLLAAYQTVLHRYSGQDDIITGSPTAGRSRQEVEGLIGYFANILAMRTSFAGAPTFGALLERISEGAMDAFEHEDVPFEKLVLDLRAGQETPGHAPLFRCVLTMEDTLPDQLRLGSAAVRPYTIDYGQAKFDLTLLVAEQPEGLRLGLWYRTDLFTKGYAERFLGHLRAVLDAAVADAEVRVDAIPLTSAAERASLDAWNATRVDEGTPATLVELFARAASQSAGRPAVVAPRASATAAGSVAGTQVLTYAELDARTSQLARFLRGVGASANAPVGLLLDRSADAVVGLLGILKAGAAYMPLSVDAPAARIAQQLTESGAKVVVTSLALRDRLPSSVQVVALDAEAETAAMGALPQQAPEVAITPSDLAYVLFTSGSTGVPKGVAVTHANAVHYARAISRVLADMHEAPGDGFAALANWRFGMASTLAADLGNTSLLPALLSGATLHVLGKEVTTEPARFAEYVSVHQLDVLKATPNHVLALAAGKTGAELAAVLPKQWLVLGGEALRLDAARTFLGAGGCRVLNHYGPTETTVGVLTHEVTAASLDAASALGAQTVPLGRPLGNTQAFVVDAYGNEQPVGIPGELWLGGAGVTQGYLNRPVLTAERFTTFRGVRVYRTGDRVRRLPDGTMEFLGRADDQVKVRGYRVELGEVEQALRAHPGVAQGVVIKRDEELVAYAVAKQAGYAVSHSDRPTSEKLTEWLAAQLPAYMVPSAVVLLEQLPLTANGKLDRAALPAPDAVGAAQASAFVAPRSETETVVAKIWRDVLKKEQVSVTDSFLDLGGHSLLAIRVLGRISKELGVRLALRALFETPTVEKVAAIIDAELAERRSAEEMARALAAVESLSDADVARLLEAESQEKQT